MTEGEMQKMQQEAIRRAQEMHRRANSFSAQSPHNHENSPAASVEKPEQEKPAEVPSGQYRKPPETASDGAEHSGGIFDTLFKDKEKTLILAIMLLLMDEKTDNGLLMALMYLLI